METLINKRIQNRWLLFLTGPTKHLKNQDVVSSDTPLIKWHVRFTTLIITPLSVQVIMIYPYALRNHVSDTMKELSKFNTYYDKLKRRCLYSGTRVPSFK